MSRLKDAILGKSDDAKKETSSQADAKSTQQSENFDAQQERQGPVGGASRVNEINRGTEEDARLGIGLGAAAGLGAILGKP